MCLTKSDGKATPADGSPIVDMSMLEKGQESTPSTRGQADGETVEQISAADYDPSLDRREDEEKRVRAVIGNGEHAVDLEVAEVEEDVGEEDDVDDMFALATNEKKKKVRKVTVRSNPFIISVFRLHLDQKLVAPALITTTLDSASDPEGYYQVILGEQLDGGRYQVFSSLGKGMFANVVRARVLQGEVGEAGKEVDIKIVRSQESM